MRQRNNYKKAVEVAQDVIKWLNTKKLQVLASNGYVQFNYDKYSNPKNEEGFGGLSLQKVLPELLSTKKPCQVCALGACFIAHVDKNNEFEIPTEYWSGDFDRDSMEEQLEDTFTYDQMSEIENAFEAYDNFYGFYEEELTDLDKPEQFGLKYKDDTKRLRAIMNNIIENNGVFKP